MPLALVALLALAPKQRFIVDIEIAPNDQWMAVTTASDNIYIYTFEGKLLQTLHHRKGSALIDVEISDDGSLIACSNADKTTAPAPVWSTKTWKEVTHFGLYYSKTKCDPPSGIDFAAKGKYIIGCTTFSHQLVCWDARTGEAIYVQRKKKSGTMYGFTLNPHGTLVAYREGGTNVVWLTDFENPKTIAEWGDSIPVDASKMKRSKFSHDMKRYLVVSEPFATSSQFDIFQPSHGKAVRSAHAIVKNFANRDITWSYDDKLIWAGGLEGQIICVDPESGHLIKHWKGNQGDPIHGMEALHHSHRLVTGGKDVDLWDGDTGKLIRTIALPKQ